MRLLLICVICSFFQFSTVVGQINAEAAKNHVIIKFSPLPLFDADNTVQFGVEVPLGKRGFSLQQDLGYGHSKFSMWYSDYTNPPNKATFKSRTQLRYYYFDGRKVRGYMAGELLLKKVVYRNDQWVGMDCSEFGTCGFFQNQEVKIGRFVGAGHFRMGWQFYFGSRMALDMFTGFGIRSIHVKAITPGLQNMRYSRPREMWSDTSPGSREVVPSLVLGFHLGIILGKFED
ncbi:MAG: hypothetical protein ABIN80_04560 [Dyadobacter sp.]|uniref:hypothetical protein n=1 Tax=Dyadobacter sp. TaxID=1914288 RepID=UPI0032635193